MKVSAKITAQFENEGRLKAIATVCLDGKFLITGVRVADCEKGLAVFMPSRKLKTGEYKDICFPITPEFHKQIKDTVLSAYEQAKQPEEEASLPAQEPETEPQG